MAHIQKFIKRMDYYMIVLSEKNQFLLNRKDIAYLCFSYDTTFKLTGTYNGTYTYPYLKCVMKKWNRLFLFIKSLCFTNQKQEKLTKYFSLCVWGVSRIFNSNKHLFYTYQEAVIVPSLPNQWRNFSSIKTIFAVGIICD